MTRKRTKAVVKSINELRKEFWEAPEDALLDRKTTAAGFGYSFGWMEVKACVGGGVPFIKIGKNRLSGRCLYRKSDALNWLAENGKAAGTVKNREEKKTLRKKESEPVANCHQLKQQVAPGSDPITLDSIKQDLLKLVKEMQI